MDQGLDTGDMLLVEKLSIAPTDTTASLHDRPAGLGGRMIVEALEIAGCGGLHRTPQPVEGVNYAHKIEKAEALIDWSLDAATLAAPRARLQSLARSPAGWASSLRLGPWPRATSPPVPNCLPAACAAPMPTACVCRPAPACCA